MGQTCIKFLVWKPYSSSHLVVQPVFYIPTVAVVAGFHCVHKSKLPAKCPNCNSAHSINICMHTSSSPNVITHKCDSGHDLLVSLCATVRYHKHVSANSKWHPPKCNEHHMMWWEEKCQYQPWEQPAQHGSWTWAPQLLIPASWTPELHITSDVFTTQYCFQLIVYSYKLHSLMNYETSKMDVATAAGFLDLSWIDITKLKSYVYLLTRVYHQYVYLIVKGCL